jgi:hypothetical protein
MSKTNRIRSSEGYDSMPDPDIVARGIAVDNGMTGNPNFTTPPIDLTSFRTAIEKLSALIADSLDGSKRVIAEKRQQRELVIKMLRLLARYVELHCDGDMATFKSSGFEPLSTIRNPRQHLSQNIRWIRHGPNSGQLVVGLKAILKALSYELRYGPAVNGNTPDLWTTQLVTRVKEPLTFKGLTAGTTYAFQVRAMEVAGYTDWSDSVTFMCI